MLHTVPLVMEIFSLCNISFLCLCTLVYYVYHYRRKQTLPFPPGLRRWPIVGNAFSIPLTYVHVFYKNLGERLGTKIMYLEAFGLPIIVLNDIRMARDLLEKRSGSYSSRPQFRMVNEVIGTKVYFATMPYGDEWRNHRRIFQQHFSLKNLPRDQERQLEFVRKCLLPNLYQSSQDVRDHVRNCIGGFSTSMTYGLPVQRINDPLVEFAENVFAAITSAGAPGKYLVNLVPPLKYVPEWMPGAGFKKYARVVREQVYKLMEEPYQATLKNMDEGKSTDCFVSESLERHRNSPDFELQAQHIKQAATQIFGAASETTVAATMTFILAMLINPDIQRKAQQELDSVVGSDRLPDFSDRPHLPYLSAIIKETLRWNPISPVAVPHYTTEEDTYEGYYIPKGCMVMANTYAMLHDEKVFPDPEEFKPERFIKNGIITDDILDPETVATFGFGRRICPGSHIALSMIYIIAASILSLFDILPMLDGEGNPIKVVPEFIAASIVSEPLPFQCRLIPRQGKNVEGLLKGYFDVEVI